MPSDRIPEQCEHTGCTHEPKHVLTVETEDGLAEEWVCFRHRRLRLQSEGVRPGPKSRYAIADGGQSGADSEQLVPVAKCPNCGYIYGDDLDYRFPSPSVCLKCDEETENTTMGERETVESLAGEKEIATDGGEPQETDTEHSLLRDDRADAVLSEDREYRYSLTRTWNPEKPTLAWIMLNPSTADETEDDPTIRRCLGYADDWGYGEIVVVNLFALRATDPSELRDHENPVGEDNDEHLRRVTEDADRVVAAWGANGDLQNRGREVARTLDVDLYALDTTEDGHPVHPLYQPSDAEPEPWDERALLAATDGGQPSAVTDQYGTIEEHVGTCRTCDRRVVGDGSCDGFQEVERELASHIDDGTACHDYSIQAVYQDGGERRV